MAEELTDQEYREQSAAKIWGGVELPKQEVIEEPEEIKEEPEEIKEETQEEPTAGVDPAIKALIDAKLGEINNLTYRLSQAEKRVGGLQNALQNQPKEKQAEKAEVKEPEVDKEWEALKEEYPEDAEKFNAIEKKFAGKSAEKVVIPDVDAIRTQLETDFSKKLTDAQQSFEERLLTFAHKDWKQQVSTPEYAAWLVTQAPDVQEKANHSNDAMDAIEVISAYKESRKQPEEKKESITEQREKRLARSTETPRTGKTAKTKLEADMTDDEYREYSARKIWGK